MQESIKSIPSNRVQFSNLGYFLMFITPIVVLLFAKQTIIHMKKKEICIIE